MDQIRYKQRICEDKEKIDRFLSEKRVGTLSMCEDAGMPYALPVNYVYQGGKIYIHGMGSGKKNLVLKENANVCFIVFEEFGTVADPVPSKCDTAYLSVMIQGKAVLVEDLAEKTQALTHFLQKFVPGLFKDPLSMQFVEKYHSSFDNNATAVYAISTEQLTAKENPIDLDHMFRL